MIRRKILYVLILAAAVWLCMLYTFQGLRFIGGILLLIPFFCFFFLLLQVPCCRVEAEKIPLSVTRGENVRLSVTAIHKGILPLAALQVKVKWSSYGAASIRKKCLLQGMGSRCEKTMEYEFPAEHCGRAELTVAKAKIYDCLGLFSMPVKTNGTATVLVTPVISSLQENEKAMILALIRRQSGAKDGDYFVRDYRPGDSPRSIHWKLTAKGKELQVKDFEPDNSVTLFLNMTDELLAEPEKRDTFFDRACSVMAFFSELGNAGTTVVWAQEGTLRGSRIEDGDELYACISELIGIKRVGNVGEDLLLSLRQGCHLEADGRLYIGEQCAYEE